MWLSSLLRDVKQAPGCLVLISALSLVAGYMLPRPAKRGGDMLDAVAAVQRRSPRFLISEVSPPAHWAQMGALYLCRQQKSVADMDDLSKDPARPDPRWAGVVCFKGTADPNQLHVPWVAEGGDRCLKYDTFAVFGDAEVLQEVQTILAAEGFHTMRGP